MPNYTLGRGRLHFSPFIAGGQVPQGLQYFGNTPEFNLNVESESLDHYNADEGVREKDDGIPIEITRTGSFIADDIQGFIVGMFFYGVSSLVSQSAASSQTWNATVKKGRRYLIGSTLANPAGVRGLTVSAVTAGGTAKAAGTDYVVDGETGLIYILPDGTIADDAALVVTYATLARQFERVTSGSTPTEGQLFYESKNPKGAQRDFMMPYVRLTPNGDLALKGDEWMQIPFNIEVLKPNSGAPAITANGRPYAI